MRVNVFSPKKKYEKKMERVGETLTLQKNASVAPRIQPFISSSPVRANLISSPHVSLCLARQTKRIDFSYITFNSYAMYIVQKTSLKKKNQMIKKRANEMMPS